MGLVMNTGSIKSQLEAMNEQLNVAIARVEKVSEDISSFRETADKLKGETYSSTREMYGAFHEPVVKQIREYAQAMIRENNSYMSCINGYLGGIGYVDEDELKKDRDIIKQQISYIQNVATIRKIAYSGYLSCLQITLDLVEKKLRQIKDFKGASTGLYQGMDSHSFGVKSGIAVLKGKQFNKKTQRYEISAVRLTMVQEEMEKSGRLNMADGKRISEGQTPIDEFCLKYLKEHVPEIITPDYIPGMPSSDVERRRRFLEENYVARIKQSLMCGCPEIVGIYNCSENLPTSVKDMFKIQLEKEIEDTYLQASQIREQLAEMSFGENDENKWGEEFLTISNCMALIDACKKYDINSPKERAYFLGQVFVKQAVEKSIGRKYLLMIMTGKINTLC